MKKLLITGATGTVGLALLGALQAVRPPFTVLAGVRELEKDAPLVAGYNVLPVKFDFTDASTFEPALRACDLLFLLRPPALANVPLYFKPLLNAAKKAGVSHIVFLSVQGVEHNKMIPHYKIERLIEASEIPFTFLRPAYFMQNFTTSLKPDLVMRHRIYLPAGNAKFTLVDVRDIAAVAAQILIAADEHRNQKYELTSQEKLTFGQMAQKLSTGLGVKIVYQSPNLLQFFIAKKRDKMPSMLILVIIMLHYLPRFQKEPRITDCIQKITGHQPKTFEEFIEANKERLLAHK